MARYNPISSLDDPLSRDGDAAWAGFASRANPNTLTPGLAAEIRNLRLDQNTAKPRKGAITLPLGIDLELDSFPVILPFTFPRVADISSMTVSISGSVKPDSDFRVSVNDVVLLDGRRLNTEYDLTETWLVGGPWADGAQLKVDVWDGPDTANEKIQVAVLLDRDSDDARQDAADFVQHMIDTLPEGVTLEVGWGYLIVTGFGVSGTFVNFGLRTPAQIKSEILSSNSSNVHHTWKSAFNDFYFFDLGQASWDSEADARDIYLFNGNTTDSGASAITAISDVINAVDAKLLYSAGQYGQDATDQAFWADVVAASNGAPFATLAAAQAFFDLNTAGGTYRTVPWSASIRWTDGTVSTQTGGSDNGGAASDGSEYQPNGEISVLYPDPPGIKIFNDYTDGARTSGVWRGEAYRQSVVDVVEGGVTSDLSISYRGRLLTHRGSGLETDLTLQDWLVLVFSDKVYLYDPAREEVARSFDLPADDPVPDSDQVSVLQAFDDLLVWRGKSGGEWLKPLRWNGDPASSFAVAPDAVANSDIPRASYGVYAQGRLIVPMEYVEMSLTSLAFDHSVNLVTATAAVDHGLTVGERVTIAGAALSLLNGTHRITEIVSATVFKYAVTLTTTGSESSGLTVQVQSRDQFVVSGDLEIYEYDLVDNHFRVNQGTPDWLIGFVPFQQDRLLVLMRKSIHVLNGISNPGSSTLRLVTEEVGCVGRRTAQVIGEDVFFLSDQGVYSLRIVDELNLRGSGEPLSEPINNFMRRINLSAANMARSAYLDNRYYLAVPLDGAVRNNAIFVYNILNSGWESIDTYPESLYYDELLVAERLGEKRLFGVSREGGIILLEEREDGDEVGTIGNSAFAVVPVNGLLLTRGYLAGDSGIKRWLRYSAEFQVATGDSYTVQIEMDNPDNVSDSRTHTETTGGNVLRRAPIRKRGFAAQLRFTTQTGRPELRLVNLEGTLVNQSNRTFR